MNTQQKQANGITPYWARTKAAAQHFQISEMTLWRWRKQEGFPQPLKRGRTVLYDIAAIEEWMQQSEN